MGERGSSRLLRGTCQHSGGLGSCWGVIGPVKPVVSEFSAWYEATAPGVFATLRVALGDDMAEDALSEAYTRAFMRWGSVRGMESPTGWVYTVALNHARSAHRRRRREVPVELDSLVHLGQATSPTERQDELWQAVQELSESARTAIALRYVADLPEAQIAELMGVTRGTVSTTLYRARKTLEQRLAATQREPTP